MHSFAPTRPDKEANMADIKPEEKVPEERPAAEEEGNEEVGSIATYTNT